MKPTPIADIKELPHKALVYSTTGTLSAVYQVKEGIAAASGKAWRFQNLELTSGGQKIKVKLDENPFEVPANWRNREVIIEAHQGTKGWAGCYAHDDTYQGKTERILRLTGTGKISLLDNSGHAEEPAQKPATRPPATPTAARPQRPAQEPQDTTNEPGNEHRDHTEEELRVMADLAKKKALRDTQNAAIQCANLQLMALNLTEDYTAKRFEAKSGRALTAEEKHSFAMNLTIELMRGGHARNMPTTKATGDTTTTTAPAKPATPPPAKPAPRQAPQEPDATGWDQANADAWPDGAVPHPESGLPMNPETGELY